ncbi:hypothetical protein ACP6PK_22100 [Dapis sp. BLCC M172]
MVFWYGLVNGDGSYPRSHISVEWLVSVGANGHSPMIYWVGDRSFFLERGDRLLIGR